jgi:hypothetical protein
MEEIELNSWREFEQKIEQIRTKHRSDEKLISRLLYRGQSDATWGLKTTLERHKNTETSFQEYLKIISYLQPEIETFTQNHWETPEYERIARAFAKYESFHMSPVLYEVYGYMAHLRHNGFPSPLLDWTRSARVAAYFAFSDATNSERVSLYVLSESTMHSGGGGQPQIRSLGPNVKTHRRHFLQQCEYTMCGVFKDGEWWFADHDTAFEKRNDADDLPVNFANYKFTLPASERTSVLEMLSSDNVNAFTLFGSEESLMSMLALREFHFPDPYFGKNIDP